MNALNKFTKDRGREAATAAVLSLAPLKRQVRVAGLSALVPLVALVITMFCTWSLADFTSFAQFIAASADMEAGRVRSPQEQVVRQPSKLSFCMTPREINNICVPHPNCPKPDPERRGSCHETISIARHAPRIMCRTSRVQVGSGRSVVGTWMETTYLQGMAYELARELISSRIGSLSSEIGVEEPR